MQISTALNLPNQALSVGGRGFGAPFFQNGPTLDLVFAGVATTLLTNDPTINLDLTGQAYQVAAQYSIWE